ncbi:hypothetical protein [Variovorax sp. DT-64]|jgi:hypothetical protein|uniref:hypothetical protein n=1 Tax=Variovorax sp. DT-64 TaxID=3396160 RepID=UPI003F1D8A89
MEASQAVETGAAAFLFAAVFLAGGRVHPFRSIVRDRRSVISFSAGMAMAYVFVHVMPELAAARRSFKASVNMHLRYEGMAIYFFALVGFLVFYGLDHLRKRLPEPAEAANGAKGFRLHLAGFAAYAWLVAYLLVHNLEETAVSTALYAVAIAFHFLAVDHALRHEHGAVYERVGRFVLAGMCVLGWVAGQLFALPHHVVAPLVAFLSGAIIMNSTIMELPSESDGRFLPFVTGGLVYGLILLPLG